MRNELFDIAGNVVVITGGAGVLGGSIAKYLVAQGAKVAIISRTSEHVENMLTQLREIGPDILGFTTDVLQKSQLEKAKSSIIEKWGSVDVLINAAGGNKSGATIGEEQTIFDLNIDDFTQVGELNLNGSVLPSIVFGKVMASQGTGSIINFSSMAADRAITRVVGYSAAKAAIDNFTKWMATEMALKFGDGIRVNAIAPGFFIGNQNRNLLTNADGTYTNRGNTIINNTPMRRFGNADELNGVVHWLCSSASAFVTGTIISVDGGFSAYSGV